MPIFKPDKKVIFGAKNESGDNVKRHFSSKSNLSHEWRQSDINSFVSVLVKKLRTLKEC